MDHGIFLLNLDSEDVEAYPERYGFEESIGSTIEHNPPKTEYVIRKIE
jgi:hypothetical protein